MRGTGGRSDGVRISGPYSLSRAINFPGSKPITAFPSMTKVGVPWDPRATSSFSAASSSVMSLETNAMWLRARNSLADLHGGQPGWW